MPYKAKLTTRTLSASTVTTDNLNKGSELTFQQADSNFLNLRDQSIGIAGDDSTTIDIGMGNTLKVAGAGTVTTAVSGQTLTITGTGGSSTGITVVGDDSTGTLIADGETIKIAGGTGITTAMSGDILTITATGAANLGDLQVNGTTLSPINTNSDLTLTANGTGKVILYNLNWPTADGTVGQVLSTDGAGQLSFISSGGTGDLTITGSQILGPSNGDIDITPGGTGNLNLRTDTVRVGDSANSGVITNFGAGYSLVIGSDFGQTGCKTSYGDGGNIITTIKTAEEMEIRSSSTSDASLEISLQTTGATIKTLPTGLGAGNKNLTLTPDGTGDLILDGLKWPQADGTANQVIKTNGSGQLSFTSVNSIASTYVHYTITDPYDGSTTPTNISVDFANGAMQTISLAGDAYDIQTPTNMTTGSILYLLFGSTRAGGSNVGFPTGYNAYGNGRFGVNQNQRVIWTIFYNGTDYIATTSANLST